MLKRLAILLISCTTPLIAQSTSASTGSIGGSVLNSDGSRLEGATVYVLPALRMQDQIQTVTDEHGNFMVSGIPFGEVYVSAYDEDKGYPYDFFSFFLLPGQEPKKVVVAANSPAPNIVIRLGAKAAHLDLSILGEDGTPVTTPAQLFFTRPDIPGDYRRATVSHISLLVPPVPFRLAIEVDGFRRWTFPDDTQSMPGELTPHSGEELKVTAHLKR